MRAFTSSKPQLRKPDFSGAQVFVLFVSFTCLITIPIWTHRLPPLSDYVNHLARMWIIASPKQSQLARFYEVDWQVIPNLTMDAIVPLLARVMNIYIAGQVFIAGMFALIASGVMALNRALFGRWSVAPLVALPFLYNYVFLVGLMNYIFGIGIALWGVAAWIALRDRAPAMGLVISTGCVILLFFCHLSALGIYGVGVLSVEILRLWEARPYFRLRHVIEFVLAGAPFLAAVPLLLASPTMQLAGSTYWEQLGKVAGLMYVFSDYSDIAAFGLLAILAISAVWAARRGILQFHALGPVLLIVGGAVYLALPRVMFDTYMADQRVPLGIAFMLFACGNLELRYRALRTGFISILILVIAMRLIEVDVNWSLLSDSTSQFRSSVRRIEPGSKVFVAYGNASSGDEVSDLGLVHAACLAVIERSSLVTTLFTVFGKQIVHVRPQYRDYADTHDGTPPSVAQMLVAASQPLPTMPAFWLNWPKFDYVYILFTEDDAPNPDPLRLRLVDAGDRFQLYRVIKAEH